MLFTGFLSKLERLELVTEQVVVSMETGVTDESVGLIGSTTSIRVKTELQQTEQSESLVVTHLGNISCLFDSDEQNELFVSFSLAM